MSDFEDALSFGDSDISQPMSPVQALRKRRPIWDEQLAKEIPALQEVQVNLWESGKKIEIFLPIKHYASHPNLMRGVH